VIEVRKLRCGYGSQQVLEGVSFTVAPGEFVGILGPNGSGKTTLLLALTGVVPLWEGCIEVCGDPLGALGTRERALRMAAVSQDGEPRFPYPCREVVRMGRYPHQNRWQLDSAEDRDRVEQALRLTDCLALADRLITAISGGERQRVMLARALAQNAPILLLDEATSAMDVHRRLQAFSLFERLNRERRLTVLSVMHDVNLAALFCRRIMFLKEGRVFADGATAEILTADIVEQVYETRAMISEIAEIGKLQVTFLPPAA
jgi:iron complex transport system ATP-binding protein